METKFVEFHGNDTGPIVMAIGQIVSFAADMGNPKFTAIRTVSATIVVRHTMQEVKAAIGGMAEVDPILPLIERSGS